MSPVIGMIMILAISVAGIAAIVAWGLPAIDEMKATVESRAVANQFKELDQDVKQLVAGTAEKTAKRWQPSLSRGSIDFLDGSQRWVLGYATCDAGGTSGCNDRAGAVSHEYSWTLTGWEDPTSHSFVVRNNHPTTTFNIQPTAASLDNGAAADLVVNHVDAYGQTAGQNIAPGASVTFYLYRSTGPQPLNTKDSTLPGSVFRITLTDAATTNVAGEFWIFDVGEARFRLDTVGSLKTVHLSNGAVIVGTGGNKVVDNTPGIPVPRKTPEGWSFFVRGVSFLGGTSFAGEDRFDVLITLYGTSTLTDTTGGETYLYVAGDHRYAWQDYLSNQRGYAFEEDPFMAGDVIGLRQRIEHDGAYQATRFTFVHSVIRVDR